VASWVVIGTGEEGAARPGSEAAFLGTFGGDDEGEVRAREQVHLLAVAAVTMVAMLGVPDAEGTFPRKNGGIAYLHRPDGSDLQELGIVGAGPAWRPVS
jgi:hypothetical protein